MATNINNIIFTRTAQKKKLEIINSLSQGELLAITYPTILRIIKEAGQGDSSKVRCKFKTLFLENAGNKWNSEVTSIYNAKKDEVYLSVYIQGDDTDTHAFPKLKDFLDNRYEEQCLGKLHESFRNGYEHYVPANYNRTDRARVIKAILTAYIENKYSDKLKELKSQIYPLSTIVYNNKLKDHIDINKLNSELDSIFNQKQAQEEALESLNEYGKFIATVKIEWEE